MTNQQKLSKLLSGKRILFLENDYGLYHGLDWIEEWLIDNKVQYNCLYNLQELPLGYITEMLGWYDALIFQSQFVYSKSRDLRDYIIKSRDKKLIIEAAGYKPHFEEKPRGIIHDVYTIRVQSDDARGEEMDVESWKIKRLKF